MNIMQDFLQFRNARAAIGAGFQHRANLGSAGQAPGADRVFDLCPVDREGSGFNRTGGA
jgi:hypothetical protein